MVYIAVGMIYMRSWVESNLLPVVSVDGKGGVMGVVGEEMKG